MKITLQVLLLTSITFASGWESVAQEPQAAEHSLNGGHCLKCHGEKALWEGDKLRLFVAQANFAADIHWQNGMRCHDCHGGDPMTSDVAKAHAVAEGFRRIESPADIPEFCGGCHSDFAYMRRFHPSSRSDQLAQYWTSGHGQRLKKDGDPKVATCVSCHQHHGVRRVDDLESPVFKTNLAQTCATCHSDPKLAEGREYHGRPMNHNQLELWKGSVHGEALLKRGNLSAPSCNDCHASHGAAPPDVDSVANACGRCHVKIGSLFARARMKHQFEEIGLPGCATCHGSHDIRSPSDEMLGMGEKAVCAHCHAEGQFGAPLAGALAASDMRAKLEKLKARIAEAKVKLSRAERLGMEVRGPRYELHQAVTALTNARSLIHSFSVDPMSASLDEGLQVADQVVQGAEAALHKHNVRRIWLGACLIPILIVVLLLAVYIRILPSPAIAADAERSRLSRYRSFHPGESAASRHDVDAPKAL